MSNTLNIPGTPRELGEMYMKQLYDLHILLRVLGFKKKVILKVVSKPKYMTLNWSYKTEVVGCKYYWCGILIKTISYE